MPDWKPPDACSEAAPRGTDNPCVTEMKALAAGHLKHWHGLRADCGLAHVEAALAPATGGVPDPAMTSGPREYAPTAGAPYGITVHYDEGRITYVSIVGPLLSTTLVEALGAPDGRLPSGLEGADEQWIYSERGLACHMCHGGGEVNWLYAFQPVPLATYEQSPLSKVCTIRHGIDGPLT